jgi:starvation-inducible outer membrane lipoprotein
MSTLSSRLIAPLATSALLSGAILAGCADVPDGVAGPYRVASMPTVAPTAPLAAPEGRSTATDVEMLRAIPASPLTPEQGADARNLGARIRWAGAIQQIDRADKRACLTVLYAQSDDDGAPRWTNDPTYQSFQACSVGAYDPALISEFTNITVVGRISGKASLGSGGSSGSGPVVQIEKLFRWSDCLEGDTTPVCKAGFIDPQPAPAD